MRLRYLLIFAPFILTLLACQLISNVLPLASPTKGNFSALLFCQDKRQL